MDANWKRILPECHNKQSTPTDYECGIKRGS